MYLMKIGLTPIGSSTIVIALPSVRNLTRKGECMAKNEKTSKKVGKIASKLMHSKSKAVRTVAASALTQRPNKKKKK